MQRLSAIHMFNYDLAYVCFIKKLALYCTEILIFPANSVKCKCVNVLNVNVSRLLSAAYKMTSGSLHVSLGTLVTCETQ